MSTEQYNTIRVQGADGLPLRDYEAALEFLMHFTHHAVGQIVEVLYYVDSDVDPVSCITAIGTKDVKGCGPDGEYNANRYLNKQYDLDTYPYGPCGAEFFEIISKGAAGSSTGTGGAEGVYKVTTALQPRELDSQTLTNLILDAYPEVESIEDGGLCVVEFTSGDRKTYITYVYSLSTWSMVDVSADHVIFYDGVHRTELWGSQDRVSDGIVQECVGKSLKEVLDYYLIKNHIPTPIAQWNLDNTPMPSVRWTNDLQAIRIGIDGVPTTITGTKVVSVNQLITYIPNTWSTDISTIGVMDVTHGPATVVGCTYGAVASEMSTVNGTTITGTNTFTTTHTIETYGDVEYKISIGSNFIASDTTTLSVTPYVLTPSSQDTLSLQEGCHAISQRIEPIGAKTKITRQGGVLYGIGNSSYKSSLGDIYPCSSLVPNVTTNLEIDPDTKEINMLSKSRTSELHIVRPIRTNGTPTGSLPQPTQSQINTYSKYSDSIVDHPTLIDYFDSTSDVVYIGFGNYKIDETPVNKIIEVSSLVDKSRIVVDYWNTITNSWVHEGVTVEESSEESLSEGYKRYIIRKSSGPNLWRITIMV